jgi:hypothetical protein
MRSPIQPQTKRRALHQTGEDKDARRLTVGDVPFLQDERQEIPDQKEVEEIEHFAEIGG